jgi:hypothetical protein
MVGLLASLLLGSQIEDKAFSFAVLFLLAMSLPDPANDQENEVQAPTHTAGLVMPIGAF